jgi:hypothetical protein
MKWYHWLAAVFVLYELVIGTSEILSGLGTINPLSSIVTWPSVGGYVQSTTATDYTLAGGIDLASAFLTYVFVLHGKEVATLGRLP